MTVEGRGGKGVEDQVDPMMMMMMLVIMLMIMMMMVMMMLVFGLIY